MFGGCVIILFVNFALVASRSLVPTIRILNTPNAGFQLAPTEGGYQLQIKRENGYTLEKVKEIAPGELHVEGVYLQKYVNNVGLLVAYKAGRDGYLARFQIRTKEKKYDASDFADYEEVEGVEDDKKKPQSHVNILLRTGCLKACAG
ncbi:hypothetical protein KR044_001137 [Drosophila immigrans]|nr:hypothetical protein KR044_001137 [Drosophila immigrans]